MKDVPPPRQRDKMPGRYAAYWWLPDITNSSRHVPASRWRRRKEQQQLRRYLNRRKDDE